MTPFRAWRNRLSLSQREAAARLDYGKRKVEAWDRGEEEPPLVVRFAMSAIEAGIDPAATGCGSCGGRSAKTWRSCDG